LTKTELISKLTEMNPNLGRDDCRIVVATIFGQIAAALSRGDRVEMRGFGIFSVKRHKARVRQNPRTGATVQLSENYAPRFKPSRLMGRRFNE
jgi:integration host factor subunit beta